jgi:Glycosyl transferase 4-like domain
MGACSLIRNRSAEDKIVAIVSPYFPPSMLAGVHRARHLVKHLPAAGWHPIVLCVDERDHDECLDAQLAHLLPEDAEIVKVRAAPMRMTRFAGIGDISLRAQFSLRRALIRILKMRRVSAVMITGAPYYPMLLAGLIRKRAQLPVVLDFQDPWVSNWGAAQPQLSKRGVVHQLALRLEPHAIRNANFITSVSDVQNAEMAARYPWLDTTRMAAIPVGGDPEDFIALRRQASAKELLDEEPDRIHLSYVGTFLPHATSLVRTLFRGFARLRAKDAALAKRIRLNFVGTSNQPSDISTYQVRPIAEAEGVADSVTEIPQRLPYMRALSWVARSHGLLLLGSDEPHYTASKVYPSLMSGRPYISLFHRASSAHAILSAAGGGRALSFTTHEELSSLERPLSEAIETLAVAPQLLGAATPEAYAEYTAPAIAQRFAAIFDRLGAEGAQALTRH